MNYMNIGHKRRIQMKNFNIKNWLQKLPKHFTITKLEKKQNQIIIKITIEDI